MPSRFRDGNAAQGPDSPFESALARVGPLRRIGAQRFSFEQIDSTNAFLLANAEDFQDGAVAWAEFQSAGRGRLGRRWLTARGMGVLVSVLLKEEKFTPLIPEATRLACVCSAEAVEKIGACRVRVRWPNDLSVGGLKLGGVLAEVRRTSPSSLHAVVIGIGLNCCQTQLDFAPEVQPTATSVRLATGRLVDRYALTAAILERLDEWVATFGEQQATYLQYRWRQYCQESGERVRLRHDGAVIDGVIRDISVEGDLLVETLDGETRRFPAATTTRLWETSTPA